MECLEPILLKSGLLVPCGTCELCQSRSRTEKSVLMQIHCDSYERMPLFIGLSYAPEFLPYRHTVSGRYWRAPEVASIVDDEERSRLVPSLYKQDVSRFLKSYKQIHDLRVTEFTYFGCGEYGQDAEYTNRPHYHLIWFGDSFLEKLYDKDVHKSENWLAQFWQFGNVDINVAEWSGIHYVTKYCLKDDNRSPEGAYPAYCIVGKNIGNNWLHSIQAQRIKQQILYLQYNKDKLYQDIDINQLNWDDDYLTRIDLLRSWISQLKPYIPDFTVRLPSGKKAILPRKLKRKLLGSFEHFLDNPMWFYNWLVEMLEQDEYMFVNGHFDKINDKSQYYQKMEQHAISISQRIKRNNRPIKL